MSSGIIADGLSQALARNDLQPYVVAGDHVSTQRGSSWSKQIEFLLIDQAPEEDGGFAIYDELSEKIQPGRLVAVLGVDGDHPERLRAWSRHLGKVLDRPAHFFSIAYGAQPRPLAAKGPRIHAIMPVFNRKEETRTCLLSILKQSVSDRIRITVVDDGSTDGTGQMLKAEFPSVNVITGDGSLWWTGAVAKAVDTLRSGFDKDDFFLLVNNDSILQPETVSILVRESIQNGRCGVAPIALEQKVGHPVTTGFGLSRHDILLNFERQYAAIILVGRLFETESLYGRCSLFPVEILDCVDNFDAKAFPQYYGDVDFCLRARKKTFRFYVTGATCIRVQHDSYNTGSHFAFRQGPQTWAQVKNNMFSMGSLDNVIATWRYTSRHHPHRAATATLKAAWKSLRHWQPLYSVLQVQPAENAATPISQASPASLVSPRVSLARKAGQFASRKFNIAVVQIWKASRRIHRRVFAR
ncbi:MAG: glycosyltransferase family 2 protein [Methyloceanibacter sp.]|nr:glycosyltransferase family 2 protein [Methyloceanibacter sp.]